jgi:hypothetical protein
MFSEGDARKVTLPAWLGQGYGRHRLSAGLLVQFVSCPYSNIFDLLYDLDLMLYIRILTRWSRCCNISVSCGLYSNPVVMLPLVLIPPASRV